MDIHYLLEKIDRLEYQNKLLLKIIEKKDQEFYKLVIKNSLAEKDVNAFIYLCEELSKKIEEQKAEGFVYFHPLFNNFTHHLHPRLEPKEVVRACIKQSLYLPLMKEFQKYL
ncbi:DUF1878 family protein [Cytobacillus dafuensis]|uniref:DUF1878 family protein n=1 Tax=Cytobacillus dafuensis TaxID=1742359 RepID=A0A5B8Z262_CYTDA|nr:DUF1878 family protein [Cytobacillus dafuensis]QED47130.1 DUF1878 family protein [Cytobacillus dafuensis]